MRPAWQPAYIGLGSNLDDPPAQISRAVAALQAVAGTQVIGLSRLYASLPMGPSDQPDFVNAVAGVLTRQSPLDLLDALQAIEQDMGRVRLRHWGPRVIDLDLLWHGAGVQAHPRLTLPHPGISQRNFVLYPLADLAPTLDLPGQGRVGTLAAVVGAHGIRQLAHDP